MSLPVRVSGGILRTETNGCLLMSLNLSRASDEEVLARAGVTLVRLSDASPSQKSSTVSNAVSDHSEAMIGTLSVVSLGFARLRKAV